MIVDNHLKSSNLSLEFIKKGWLYNHESISFVCENLLRESFANRAQTTCERYYKFSQLHLQE
jgi:hypothetical protein